MLRGDLGVFPSGEGGYTVQDLGGIGFDARGFKKSGVDVIGISSDSKGTEAPSHIVQLISISIRSIKFSSSVGKTNWRKYSSKRVKSILLSMNKRK